MTEKKKTARKTITKPLKKEAKPKTKAAPKKVAAKASPKDSTKDLAKDIAQSAYDTKADDVIVLEVKELSGFADYFVIASGKSDRQVQSIAERIQSNLKSKGMHPLGIEGLKQGHWVLVDYGAVVAHIFHEEKREFYGLEKFWGDAPRLKFKLK